MQPLKRPSRNVAHLVGVTPVVGGPGVDLLLGADVGAVLDPRHVARVRVGPVAVGPLGVGELGEGAGVDELLTEPVVLVGRSVAPLDAVGRGQCGHLLDPSQEFRVLRRRHRRGICSFFGPVSVGSNARHVPWDPPNLRTCRQSPVRTTSCSLFGRPSETESRRSICGTTPPWSRSPRVGSLVVSVDSVVEGVHVDLSLCTPADVGWKALMGAVSDLAAMGASPIGALIALCVPGGSGNGEVALGVTEGVAEASAAALCPVVGGDVSSAGQVVVAVTVLGSVASGPPAVTRAGAAPGRCDPGHRAVWRIGGGAAPAARPQRARRGLPPTGGPPARRRHGPAVRGQRP